MKRFVLFLLAFIALGGACQADGERKGLVVLPGMVDSFPYDAYDMHPVIGQTLRHPPEGTVPYGAKRYHYGPGAKEAARAGVELANPIARDADAIERGKWAYDTFCAVCHGPGGMGDGPIIGRFPNPPSLVAPRLRDLPDGHLFHVITYGSGIMAPYAVQVPDDDRWRMIHYIRQLQGGDADAGAGGAGDGGAGGDEAAGGEGGTADGTGGEAGAGGEGTESAGGEDGAEEGAGGAIPAPPDAPAPVPVNVPDAPKAPGPQPEAPPQPAPAPQPSAPEPTP
jgi:mono/diheme cytochrome c family protein